MLKTFLFLLFTLLSGAIFAGDTGAQATRNSYSNRRRLPATKIQAKTDLPEKLVSIKLPFHALVAQR